MSHGEAGAPADAVDGAAASPAADAVKRGAADPAAAAASGAPADPLDEIRSGDRVPRHIALIMDGNGRWARARGLPRRAGHREGMKSVREAIEGSIAAGVEHLTLFAFSEENWKRPRGEVAALMNLMIEYVRREREELRQNGVRVEAFGDRGRLSGLAKKALADLEAVTREGAALRLHLAISYGSRSEIAGAARRLAERVAAGELSPEAITPESFSRELMTGAWPDPDLLIRTSGEQRISNFLLWQIAYTELYVTPVLWPDFRREHLFEAILEFRGRERRFGRVSA